MSSHGGALISGLLRQVRANYVGRWSRRPAADGGAYLPVAADQCARLLDRGHSRVSPTSGRRITAVETVNHVNCYEEDVCADDRKNKPLYQAHNAILRQ